MTGAHLPVAAVASLGLTQIIGYGTLYYSFSILAPGMARDFALSTEWIFGVLSLALFAGGLFSPWLGRAFDRFGAGWVMTFGSLAAAAALVACALAPGRPVFVVALVTMELAANLVQYGAAFALLVQFRPEVAARSITYLTLIAGFASTVFWPITTALQGYFSWREVYLGFAAANLLLCLPIHFLLARRAGRHDVKHPPERLPPETAGRLAPRWHKAGFLLMVAGFSLQSLVSSAVLVHMVPLLSTLGLGGVAAVVGSLFGPSQVASRLVNMLFGRELAPTWLAVISAALMGAAVLVLLAGAPSVAAAIAFACLFGFGSGLFSIVSGTLPLLLFGSTGYGTLQGKVMAARLIVSSVAPFAFALAISRLGVAPSLGIVILGGVIAVFMFFRIARLAREGHGRA